MSPRKKSSPAKQTTPSKKVPRKKSVAEKTSPSNSASDPPHFLLDVRREFANVRIFTARRWPRVERPEYADLYCPKCGSLDALEALNRGVSKDIVIRGDVDWASTSDGATIVSDKTRKVLSKAAPDELRFFPLRDRKHFVLWVTQVIEIPPGETFIGKNRKVAVIYSTRSRCSAWGRLVDSYHRPAEYDYSKVPNLVGHFLPNAESPARFALIVHSHVGEKLQAAGITSWRRLELESFRRTGRLK